MNCSGEETEFVFNTTDEKKSISIADFTYKERKYILKEPIEIFIDGNCASNEEFGILVVVYKSLDGYTELCAKQQLADLWGVYVEFPERELSKQAIEFKKKLMEMVK